MDESFAQAFPAILGQQVVIENVGGAGGMTGVSRVAKAASDGYQFAWGRQHVCHESNALQKTALQRRDRFAPVVLIAEQPIVRRPLIANAAARPPYA